MTCPHTNWTLDADLRLDGGCIQCWKERYEKVQYQHALLTGVTDSAMDKLKDALEKTAKAEAELETRRRCWKETEAEFQQMKERAERAEALIVKHEKNRQFLDEQAGAWEHKYDREHEVRLKAEAEAAEMRAVLETWTCDTCKGTHRWTPECYACLSGELDHCTCVSEKEQDCPQCWEGNLKDHTIKLEHALSSSCGQDFVPRSELEKIRELNEKHAVAYLEEVKVTQAFMVATELAMKPGQLPMMSGGYYNEARAAFDNAMALVKKNREPIHIDGYLSPDKARVLVEALTFIAGAWDDNKCAIEQAQMLYDCHCEAAKALAELEKKQA